MTKNDIIKMAADAGFEISKSGMPIVRHSSGAWVGVADRIENFANLVAAAEREACAKLCDVLAVHPEYASEITKLAAMAIRARSQS